jgi:MarR family 2-MHQ and catechol resistance regulon transcriptional repressor
MLLSKEVIIKLHLTGYTIKRYIAIMLRQHEIPLTPEQFMLIDLLWNEGPMTQQQLVNQLQKDKNSVTMLVDAIEKKGLVVRQQNANDRRSNTIVLTDKALDIKADAKQKGISILDNILEGISEDELHSFLQTLRKINNNIETETK